MHHRRTGNKRRAQYHHAQQRALERYGIALRQSDLDAIVRLIIKGESQLVERQSLRVSVHDVSWDGQTIRVVYDKQRRSIATVLSDGMGVSMAEEPVYARL